MCRYCKSKIKRNEVLFNLDLKNKKVQYFCPFCKGLLAENAEDLEKILKRR